MDPWWTLLCGVFHFVVVRMLAAHRLDAIGISSVSFV
jgi:hypothetical protein